MSGDGRVRFVSFKAPEPRHPDHEIDALRYAIAPLMPEPKPLPTWLQSLVDEVREHGPGPCPKCGTTLQQVHRTQPRNFECPRGCDIRPEHLGGGS